MPAEHSGVNWTTHRAYDNFRGALSARMLGVIFQRLLYWEKNICHWLSTVTVCYWTYWSEQNKEPKLLTPDTMSGLKMRLGHCHKPSPGNWWRSPIYSLPGFESCFMIGKKRSGKKRGEGRGGERKGIRPQQQFLDWPLHQKIKQQNPS